MKEFWNERYGEEAYAYGHEPNAYFKEQLAKFPPGKLLLPAEGEGRNAVYAAELGWEVLAFDISEEGKRKAEQLAQERQVEIEYIVGSLEELALEEAQFDAIGLIYAHFPAELKSGYHRMLTRSLKKGGIVIFEAFSKTHLEYNSANPKAGGPRDINVLFSVDELRADFADFEILELEEMETVLSEGLYHQGRSSVIRFTGRKL